jgi:hypothetical protein
VSRRATWFGCGTVMGVVVALFLAWRLDTVAPPVHRTLAVGDSGGQPFSRIADALADARPGDVVQLEPGTYKEQVVLPDGVDLVARLPGKATLVRADGATGEWRAVTAGGASGGQGIYGIRIDSSMAAPIDVGLHISGAGRRVELVDIEGPMRGDRAHGRDSRDHSWLRCAQRARTRRHHGCELGSGHREQCVRPNRPSG